MTRVIFSVLIIPPVSSFVNNMISMQAEYMFLEKYWESYMLLISYIDHIGVTYTWHIMTVIIPKPKTT